jgi:DNA ligase D-like protein (predicted ligase)
MFATLTDKRFSDPGWIFERKLDGVRALTFRRKGKVTMMSRNRLLIGNHYPEVVEALEARDTPDFIVDGEVVAFDHGQTSFAKLQQRMQLRNPDQARRTSVPVFYYVFDVLHAAGHDLSPLELRHRKAVLKRLFPFDDPLRLTSYRKAEGETYYAEACRRGWEGVIAKRATSPYEPGRRTPDWLKFKCVNTQEFVIGGFTDPKGSRAGFGALLIGHYDGGTLRYAGKVGTGFNNGLLRDLRQRLDRLERPTAPFDADKLPRKGIHWVEPQLVAQIGFTEWTPYGQLRHPRFEGLREDKAPREVIRERPAR